MFYKSAYRSPLGRIELVCDDAALVHLSLPGQVAFGKTAREEDHPILRRTAAWLDRYFAGQAPEPSELPLRPEGTAFRRLIWMLLLDIPYGQTTTYGVLAKGAAQALGKPRMSAQAVGQAVGANPISVIIPCHRCVGAGGALTGYAGGVHYKKALLELESPEPGLILPACVANAHPGQRPEVGGEAVVLDPKLAAQNAAPIEAARDLQGLGQLAGAAELALAGPDQHRFGLSRFTGDDVQQPVDPVA